ncbi:putative major capsid protein [Sulfolobales Beppu rod-shaped virus 1]|uniref:Putative major capsid protein n=1 Tax=Sulfolobales Beppu rod-shaped virus 1 TaxID=2493121 RepID=A0A3Q8Q416_9VIRU|nr:putative major capsid protein [Sulfolobales Beppu rod-shaped virus 1]AZI75909.1 putative major capsid protein [Sulfolobales Beppu rod-shaped virus 1]
MAKGHTPRSFAQRYAKWSAKFNAFSNPTVASTILGNVAPTAQQNFQTHVTKFTSVNEQVNAVLTQYGVTGPNRAIYQGYGMKVARALNRLGQGSALANMIAGLKAYYINAFNANPQILDAVTNIITGSPTGYIS